MRRKILILPPLIFILLLAFLFLPNLKDAVRPQFSKDKLQTDIENIPKPLLPVLSESLGRDNPAYHIIQTNDTFHAETPNHGIKTKFEGDGITFISGENRVRMFYPGIKYLEPVQVSENRIEYKRGNLTEWYVNSPYGIEQGFTLESDPDKANDEAVIRVGLEIGKDIKPIFDDKGKSITFVDDIGEEVFTYSGLYAYDAKGYELPSSMRIYGSEIQIVVDDSRAEYPIVIDPFIETQKLVASDGALNDEFGTSVSVWEDYIIVGAPFFGTAQPGKAYIFQRESNNNWNEVEILTSSDGAADDKFGISVSIYGDWAVVGAKFSDVFPVGGGSNFTEGKAYVFKRDSNGDWNETQILIPSDGDGGEQFGTSVAIWGEFIIVGAPHAGPLAQTNRGQAYIFQRDINDNWNEVEILVASDSLGLEEFGDSVSIWEDRAVVGNSLGNLTIPQGNEGKAYVFERDINGDWNEVDILSASDNGTDDGFGNSVDIFGDYIIVGARLADFTPQAGPVQVNRGKAYIFERDINGDWSEVSILLASDGEPDAEFGAGVSVYNKTAIVGAPLTNVNPPGNIDQGKSYVFKRDETLGWVQEQILIASDGASPDRFGESVSMDGLTVVVGGNRARPQGIVAQGAAWVFGLAEKNPIVTTDLGASRLVYFYDTSAPTALPTDRSTSIQVANITDDQVCIHVQVFKADDSCVEVDFTDCLTPRDVNLYDIENLPGEPDLSDSYGFVVVSVDTGPTDSLIGVFRIVDEEGYEYRTNAVSPRSSGTGGETFGLINFNDVNGNFLSDVVGITFASLDSSSVYASPLVGTEFGGGGPGSTNLIFDEFESATACSSVTFACDAGAIATGIDNSIPNSQGFGRICNTATLQNSSAGWLHLPFTGHICTDPVIGDSQTGECLLPTFFVGFIGLNNGGGTGSMDSWFIQGGE